jgi:hypothetical protein
MQAQPVATERLGKFCGREAKRGQGRLLEECFSTLRGAPRRTYP